MMDWVVVRPRRAAWASCFIERQCLVEMRDAFLTPALPSEIDRRTLPADRLLESPALRLCHRHGLGQRGRALDLQEIRGNRLGTCAVSSAIVRCGRQETRE